MNAKISILTHTNGLRSACIGWIYPDDPNVNMQDVENIGYRIVPPETVARITGRTHERLQELLERLDRGHNI